MKKIIKSFRPFVGQHCETTATGSLLKQLGLEFSEPMLFGLGEGLGFIFWNMKTMDFPFVGGRIKPDELTKNIARNLNLKLEIKETTSVSRAWNNVREYIDKGMAVGLKLDCYHLEYFSNKVHFAGHYVAMYGYDEQFAYLVDTKQQGGRVKVGLKNLELARSEKGPMSSRNLSFTIRRPDGKKDIDMQEVLSAAIRRNARDYLNPPIKNIGYKGIMKMSKEVKKWFENSKSVKSDFKTTAMLMEKAGTGGAIFRNMYRDFLKESCEIISESELKEAHKMFIEIASLWTKVSELFDKIGDTQDIRCVDEVARVLVELSSKEKSAMGLLVNI